MGLLVFIYKYNIFKVYQPIFRKYLLSFGMYCISLYFKYASYHTLYTSSWQLIGLLLYGDLFLYNLYRQPIGLFSYRYALLYNL